MCIPSHGLPPLQKCVGESVVLACFQLRLLLVGMELEKTTIFHMDGDWCMPRHYTTYAKFCTNVTIAHFGISYDVFQRDFNTHLTKWVLKLRPKSSQIWYVYLKEYWSEP